MPPLSSKYYTFDEKDTSRSPYEIIKQVKSELSELDSSLVGDVFTHQAAIGVYIGEYSLALAPQTWSRAPNEQKDELMHQFGNGQSHTWQRKAAGSAFWTFKMEWMPGWEWGFKACTDNGHVIAPLSFKLRVKDIKEKLNLADAKRAQALQDHLAGHSEWWKSQCPSKRFEHWRYADGFDLGWKDAREFFAARLDAIVPCAFGEVIFPPPQGMSMGMDGEGASREPNTFNDSVIGADVIGALDLWILKRMREVGVADPGACPCGWEWEHGFRAGVRTFGQTVA